MMAINCLEVLAEINKWVVPLFVGAAVGADAGPIVVGAITCKAVWCSSRRSCRRDCRVGDGA
jgi:hypothetical protein